MEIINSDLNFTVLVFHNTIFHTFSTSMICITLICWCKCQYIKYSECESKSSLLYITLLRKWWHWNKWFLKIKTNKLFFSTPKWKINLCQLLTHDFSSLWKFKMNIKLVTFKVPFSIGNVLQNILLHKGISVLFCLRIICFARPAWLSAWVLI